MHRDHVPSDRIPHSFHLLGSTDICANQGMVRFHSGSDPVEPVSLDQVHVITTQGHPEFDEPVVTSIIEARAQSGAIDAETAAESKERQYWPTHGIDVIGGVIWRILGVSSS